MSFTTRLDFKETIEPLASYPLYYCNPTLLRQKAMLHWPKVTSLINRSPPFVGAEVPVDHHRSLQIHSKSTSSITRSPDGPISRCLPWFNTAHVDCLCGLIQCALDLHRLGRQFRRTLLIVQLVHLLACRIVQDVSVSSGAAFRAIGRGVHAGLLHDLLVRSLERALAVRDHTGKGLQWRAFLRWRFLRRWLPRLRRFWPRRNPN